MSYILDALKKVEHERSGRPTSVEPTEISGDIFQKRMSRPSPVSAGKIILLIIFASLITIAAAWFVVTSENRKSAAIQPAAAIISVAAPALPK